MCASSSGRQIDEDYEYETENGDNPYATALRDEVLGEWTSTIDENGYDPVAG